MEDKKNISTLEEEIEAETPTTTSLDIDWPEDITPQERAEIIKKAFNQFAKTQLDIAFDWTGENFRLYDAKKLSERLSIKKQGLIELLDTFREDILKSQDLIEDISRLEPELKEELDKPEYNGNTFEEVINTYTAGQLLDMLDDPDSFFYRAMENARGASVLNAQIKGRADRHAIREKAIESGAIMELKGGNYYVFSDEELLDAFAPGRIGKMGKLTRDYIDEKTGQLKKPNLDDGDIISLPAADVSLKAFVLLNSIMANSVENVREDFIKSGKITFYVKGVLEKFTDDPRTLNDNQLDIDRKTAGVLYLEELFQPLQSYIGTTYNGSRWSVFNYIGYNAESDTMEISSPYLYQFWKRTQSDHREEEKQLEEDHKKGNRKRQQNAKIKLNYLFKGKALSSDETILEIAVYITGVLLRAGNTGKPKKTEITYKKIIKDCPRLKERLDDIESKRGTVNENGKPINVTALYNSELRKIKRAWDIILDPDKCDALNKYEFIDIQPGKVNKAGKVEFIPPTRNKINEKMIIIWSRKPDENGV